MFKNQIKSRQYRLVNTRNIYYWFFVPLVFLLMGCDNNYYYVPKRDVVHLFTVKKETYIVRSGDTLFSIAWHYGREYHQLASANGIRAPYTIYTGQRISLSKKPASGSFPIGDRVRAIKSQNQKAVRGEVKKKTSHVQQKERSVKVPIIWTWPVEGKVINKFSIRDNKGIDISAKEGTPVKAAASGVVVYAGNGLVGYGNLIIIKHSEAFLSAYAHNKRILVNENKKIKVGETIAEIGLSGASKIKLHFEIRKNGKPVNPLWYLPK